MAECMTDSHTSSMFGITKTFYNTEREVRFRVRGTELNINVSTFFFSSDKLEMLEILALICDCLLPGIPGSVFFLSSR